MPRFFVKNDQVKGDSIFIIGEDVRHIKSVLRKQLGDNIEICNQDTGKAYKCEITEIKEERINESVRRILLTKIKYGILDNYIIENKKYKQIK